MSEEGKRFAPFLEHRYFDPTAHLKYDNIHPAASAAAKRILDTLRERGHVLKSATRHAPVITQGEMQRIISEAIENVR